MKTFSLESEKVKILTSGSIFADENTKITLMENILHAFSLNKNDPQPFGKNGDATMLIQTDATPSTDYKNT